MRFRLSLLLIAAGTASACKTYDPLYCDENTPCTDPDRPFCDLTGDAPGSDGHARTCVASPFDAGPSGARDAAQDGGPTRRVVSLHVGLGRTCAVVDDGGLRCWGTGPMGYPEDVGVIGDNEDPADIDDVRTGGRVKSVALGAAFTCLLYEAGNVRCFGDNEQGRLGYGHTDPVALEPEDLDDISLGEPAIELASGFGHTCAVLESHAIRCWGGAVLGAALGYGDEETMVGDNEVPTDLPAVDVGGAVVHISLGSAHSCVILGGGDGRVRCWGINVHGQLGYGDSDVIGDDESPAVGGDVPMGDPVTGLQAYETSNCAILEPGRMTCWGEGLSILGYANTTTIGDNETAASAQDVDLGGTAINIAGGPRCALMSDGRVRCWGENDNGELGLGHMDRIGDNEKPVVADSLTLGGEVAKLSTGIAQHQCALLVDGSVRCWGLNDAGQLGLGHLENVGDNELPTDELAVRVFPD
jgi:hypothetical protein